MKVIEDAWEREQQQWPRGSRWGGMIHHDAPSHSIPSDETSDGHVPLGPIIRMSLLGLLGIIQDVRWRRFKGQLRLGKHAVHTEYTVHVHGSMKARLARPESAEIGNH